MYVGLLVCSLFLILTGGAGVSRLTHGPQSGHPTGSRDTELRAVPAVVVCVY